MRQTSQNRGLCAFEVRMRGKRKGPTEANIELQVALLASPRVSYKLVWFGRKERPAVQKATATAPWTLSALERKGTRHHTCALRSPARESAYRVDTTYVICTYVMTTPRPGQRRTCTCSPSRCSTVHLNVILPPCSFFILSTLHRSWSASRAQRLLPRPTSRGTTVPWDPLAARFARQPWC
jgi:hypothetical protein